MSIIDFLQSTTDISPEQLDAIKSNISEGGFSEEEALLEAGYDPEFVRDIFSKYYQVPPFNFSEETTISQEVLAYIPEESALHYRIIPLSITDSVLSVGVNNPEDIQVREVLNFISLKHSITYKLHFLLAKDVERGLEFYENLKRDVTEALGSFESELNDAINSNIDEMQGGDEEVPDSFEHIKEDAPITKIVATILRYAIDGSASDIHVEPSEKKVTVRFRVDGELQTSLELPRDVHMAVSARIKILASMRLDERRKPQDGRFSTVFDGRKVDFRVSVLPTNYGEKVVMRILDNEKGVRTLESVGVDGHHLSAIRRMIKEPYGIILISGPTGSGKSTTLYAMLAEVDRLTKNVLSLEDPVEYNIEGVSQSQMRPEIGYTFAQGLRAALRQDPDIIMVGEIRDKETAQLAIQAALTGHLVLSTIHTNNSIGVIPRLIDMGIDPYLIAPTLKLVIAQRLSRRLKDGKGREESVTESMRLMFDDIFESLPEKYRNRIPEFKTVMHPEPSPGCTTGMRGRVAIMETFEVNEKIQNLILKNASEEEIEAEARKQGFMTMQEDAIVKALEHVIPYEEMNAFGSKVGLDDVLDLPINTVEEAPVDNSSVTEEKPL
ncbi:MAG: GspE/PulE family protein [Candidatus Paceibacteria bacterium]